jgi:hypothetical protein
MSIANKPVVKKVEKPEELKVAPLKVTFAPNLTVSIRSSDEHFKYVIKYEDGELDSGKVDTRNEAEECVREALLRLGVCKESQDRIAQVLALDAELKEVKGTEAPCTTLNAYIGA